MSFVKSFESSFICDQARFNRFSHLEMTVRDVEAEAGGSGNFPVEAEAEAEAAILIQVEVEAEAEMAVLNLMEAESAI